MKTIETLLGIDEFQVVAVNTRSKSKVHISVETKTTSVCCPQCRQKSESIDHRYKQSVRDISVFEREAYLHLMRKVFHCNDCDYSYVEPIKSILPRHTHTKRFEEYAFENCLENSFTNVSRMLNISYDCVRGIYKRIADQCIEHLAKYRDQIEVLGIDEISIRKGHGDFQAVVSSISGGYVLDVLPDRKQETVIKYLQNLPKKAKKRIVYVSIDMWDGYFNATTQVLPHTIIVIDRFHVMKNLNAAISGYRRKIQKDLPIKDRKRYKGYRWVLVKNEENMTDVDLKKLSLMIKHCPDLKYLYELKIEFQSIFDNTKKTEVADQKLRRWEKKVARLNNDDMNRFLKTLSNWREWILNYFESNKVTNGFVEGMNNKIKLIKRIGYGYNSKINFRRRVLVECGYNNLPKSQKSFFLR